MSRCQPRRGGQGRGVPRAASTPSPEAPCFWAFAKRPCSWMIVLKSMAAHDAQCWRLRATPVSHEGNRTDTTRTLGGTAHSQLRETDCTLACRREHGVNLAGGGGKLTDGIVVWCTGSQRPSHWSRGACPSDFRISSGRSWRAELDEPHASDRTHCPARATHVDHIRLRSGVRDVCVCVSGSGMARSSVKSEYAQSLVVPKRTLFDANIKDRRSRLTLPLGP